MIKMVKVIALKPMGGHRLWVKFSDNSEGIRDFGDVIAEGGPMVEPLRAPQFFAKAFISFGRVYFIRWPKLAKRLRRRCDQSSYGNGKGRRIEVGFGGVTRISV